VKFSVEDLRSILRKQARVFHTDEALKRYLQDHPKADPSNHSVEESEKSPSKKDDPASKGPSKPKGPLFSAEETDKLPNAASQKSSDPKVIFEEAKKAHEEQLDMLNRGEGLDKEIGAKVVRADKGDPIDFTKLPDGPVVLIGPMKSQKRSKEKVEAWFGGDWGKLGDVVRASIAVDRFDDIEKVVEGLKKAGMKLAKKPTDRFAKPTEAGYRDISINVEYPNGHVGEIQLHVKSMLKAKDKGHKLYETVRDIQGKAETEGRDKFTDEEQKIVDDANAKMKKLYDDAWAEATSTKSASSQSGRSIMAAGRKFYEYEGVPAYQDKKSFPKIVTPKGDKTLYELEKFYNEATPIDEERFDALKAEKTEKKAMTNKSAGPVVKGYNDYDPRAPSSPWGPVQHVYTNPMLKGVRWVSTAGHGGMGVADGVARKLLSPAAYKLGDKWGGYVWYEEDVAYTIPVYEHPDWMFLLHGKRLNDAELAALERSVRTSYPRYFKMKEEGFALPPRLQIGDVLNVTKQINLSKGSPSLMPGDTVQIVKLTPTYMYVVSGGNSRNVKLPVWYYSGEMEWGLAEASIYLALPDAGAARVASRYMTRQG
jgi:phage terminase small subunit